MSAKPIALILGSGGNVGAGVARHFAKAGYQVAVVSRSAADPPAVDSDGYLSIKGDLGDISIYAPIYSKIKESLGGVPSVVVYNAASLNFPTEPENLFSVAPEKFKQDLDVGTHGPYTAAGEAFKLWSAENDGSKKTFIYTGNLLVKKVLPTAALVTLGVHKNATNYWLALADALYKDKGIR